MPKLALPSEEEHPRNEFFGTNLTNILLRYVDFLTPKHVIARYTNRDLAFAENFLVKDGADIMIS